MVLSLQIDGVFDAAGLSASTLLASAAMSARSHASMLGWILQHLLCGEHMHCHSPLNAGVGAGGAGVGVGVAVSGQSACALCIDDN